MELDLIHHAVSQHATAAIAQNRFQEGQALLAWLVERRPSDLPSRLALAFCLVAQDRYAEAARELPAMGHLPVATLQYLVGRIYAATGDARAKATFVRFAALQRQARGIAQKPPPDFADLAPQPPLPFPALHHPAPSKVFP